MRILVCGGRNFGHVVRTTGLVLDEPAEMQERIREYQYIHSCLNEIVNEKSLFSDPDNNWLPTDITIIQGGATGADRAAYDFAEINFCRREEYPADWKRYGKRAGYLRNQQMLDEGKPDLVVAFPGGIGTANMVDLATKAGVKVMMMGTKGSGVEAPQPKFKTNKYEKLYCDKMWSSGNFMTPYQRSIVLRDMMEEEQQWLDSMGAEYEDITAAQATMDKLNGA